MHDLDGKDGPSHRIETCFDLYPRENTQTPWIDCKWQFLKYFSTRWRRDCGCQTAVRHSDRSLALLAEKFLGACLLVVSIR